MSESLVIVIITALVNGAITWGVIRTELKYLRRDIDAAHSRLDALRAPAAGSHRSYGS